MVGIQLSLKIIFTYFAELLVPTLRGRKSKLTSRKLRAMSMKVAPTYQRLEDLEGILHDNLRASSWADEVNPIYDRVAASEVQNFIENSEVTYESLNTVETEAVSTALDNSGTKESSKKIDIYGDMDEDVFSEGTPRTKNNPSKTVAFGETEIYQDPSTQFEGPKDDMGSDVYQDPSETMSEKKKDFASGPSNNAGMDDMGDDIYQDPTTSAKTQKPTTDDPFGNDVYQDPTAIESTKKPDNGFGQDSIYQDPALTERTNIPEENPYVDLNSAQTVVKENKSKRTEPKDSYPSDTLRSSSSFSNVINKQGTLTRQMSLSMGKRPYKPVHSRLRMQGSANDETPAPSDIRRQAPRLHNTMMVSIIFKTKFLNTKIKPCIIKTYVIGLFNIIKRLQSILCEVTYI